MVEIECPLCAENIDLGMAEKGNMSVHTAKMFFIGNLKNFAILRIFNALRAASSYLRF